MPEIEKTLAELQRLMEYRARYNTAGKVTDGDMAVDGEEGAGTMEEILAIGLSLSLIHI